MPRKQRSQASRNVTTSAEDFRDLYLRRQLEMVAAPTPAYGMQEWCEKHHVWEEPLRKTDTCVKFSMPSRSDIVKEKVAAAFTYRRHGYLREGAVERFLPLPDKWKKMLKSNNMTDDETRPSGPETNKNEAQMHLPALKVNGTKTEHQTTSFSNGGSQPTGYLSLPHVHIDGPEDPMETSSMSHHQSRPASASSSNVTLPENSEVNTLFSDSEQEDQPRDESDKTEWLAKNAEKMARAVELIRSRMAARDSRDAKKSYPSPGHKIHNVNSPRRARFMTDGEYRWKAVDPRQISYFSMFAPLLDVSHVGWKRYKQA